MNLRHGREKASEPILNTKGIPHFFSNVEINNQGVLFYYDLNLASKKGAYFKTENDKKYHDDIKTIVVSPLNGWDGKQVGLIGLLYINSKTNKILNPIHIDLIAFTADTLALSYAAMFSHLYNVNNMPEFS